MRGLQVKRTRSARPSLLVSDASSAACRRSPSPSTVSVASARKRPQRLDRGADSLARVDPPAAQQPPAPRRRRPRGETVWIHSGMGEHSVEPIEPQPLGSGTYVLRDEHPPSGLDEIDGRRYPRQALGDWSRGLAPPREATGPRVDRRPVGHPVVADHAHRRHARPRAPARAATATCPPSPTT